jgi:hypothetical protein
MGLKGNYYTSGSTRCSHHQQRSLKGKVAVVLLWEYWARLSIRGDCEGMVVLSIRGDREGMVVLSIRGDREGMVVLSIRGDREGTVNPQVNYKKLPSMKLSQGPP